MIADIDFDKAASIRAALALEFTPGSVRVMQLEGKSGNSNVRSFTEVPLTDGDIVEGVVQKPQSVSNKLMEALAKAGPKLPNTPHVICLIPQRYTFLTVLDLPVADKEELREIIKRRVNDIIPMDESLVYWDWHRIQVVGNKTRVQLAAVPKLLVDSYMQTIEAAKLIPLLFEPSATAASRVAFPFDSAQLQNKTPEPIILLELGADYGVVSLMQQGGIVFSSDISLRSDSMAEKVIVLERKIAEVNQYAQNHLKVKPGSENIKTMVYGEQDQISKILPLLQERSKNPIGIIEPKYESPEVVRFINEKQNYGYFPLLGAATRGLAEYSESTTLNLIPQKAKEAFRKRELFNVLRNYLMFVAINSILLVFMLLLVAVEIRSKIEVLEQNYNSILEVSNSPAVNKLEASITSLNSRTKELDSLVGDLYDWDKLLNLINSTTPGQIHISSLSTVPEVGTGAGGTGKWQVKIAGVSQDRDSIINYVNRLRLSDLLRDVKLPVDSLQSEFNSSFVIEADLPFRNLLN